MSRTTGGARLIGREGRIGGRRRKKYGLVGADEEKLEVVGGDEERWLEEARGAAAASAW